MDDPILLASREALPVPVGVQPSSQRPIPPSQPHTTQPDKRQLAPYQALPVTGPLKLQHSGPAALAPLRRHGATQKELDEQIGKVIEAYTQKLADRTKHHLGYPYNLDFDFSALEGLQKFSINNLGDPFIESNYGVHSREFELGVLHWFARLWEIEEEEYWGYITNCGTEGNLNGILIGRENLPDGVLYASKESHYSVFKAARMYRMECERVETLPSGEIDYDDFRAALNRNEGKPAIINVNVGTTVRGAVDDVDRVIDTLTSCGYTEDRFYIHCDGALFGLMLPFVRQAPLVTFRKPIGSISVSGHKFIGAPVPCGVVITRTRYIAALSTDVEYLNSRDATIMGSRNGHAPIYMWYTLTRKGYSGMRKDVERCLRNAHLLKGMLESAGVPVMLNELSSTVVFERPKEEAFVRKWQLACEGDIAHVVVMPSVDATKLESFVEDLIACRARGALERAKQMAADSRDAHPQGTSDDEEEYTERSPKGRRWSEKF